MPAQWALPTLLHPCHLCMPHFPAGPSTCIKCLMGHTSNTVGPDTKSMPGDPNCSRQALIKSQRSSPFLPLLPASQALALTYCPIDLPKPLMPELTHLSFLLSPWDVGLTAILGNVEAEVWGWLHAGRVSMFRGDCGGVLHSECDKEPTGQQGAAARSWHLAACLHVPTAWHSTAQQARGQLPSSTLPSVPMAPGLRLVSCTFTDRLNRPADSKLCPDTP